MVKKSIDGKRHIKNQEVRDNFSQTNAYSELFMELVGDAKASADFVNGIVPSIDKVKSLSNPV